MIEMICEQMHWWVLIGTNYALMNGIENAILSQQYGFMILNYNNIVII